MKNFRFAFGHVFMRNHGYLSAKLPTLYLFLNPFRPWRSFILDWLISFKNPKISKYKNLTKRVLANSFLTNDSIGWYHLKLEHFLHLLLPLFTHQISALREYVIKEHVDFLSGENAKIVLVFHIHVVKFVRKNEKLCHFKNVLLNLDFKDS